MTNKKGFTLAELLAVIIVLGLLSLIVIPNVITAIKTSKDTIYKAQINSIIEGAKMWASDNASSMPENDETIKLTLYQLKIGAYVDLSIKNPTIEGANYFNDDMEISIKKQNGTFEYKVIEATIEYQNSVDTSYAKLELNGKTLIHINMDDNYVDQGAIYNSNNSNMINTINTVDTNYAGTNYLYYEYDGNKIIRTVIVK